MIWDILKHFKVSEPWGKPEAMNGILLLVMDAVAEKSGVPVVIHCGHETTGHVSKSYHASGRACDFHLATEMPFLKQVELMEKILQDLHVFSDVGLGIYPDWNHPGFHLDTRGTMARWGALYVKQNGKNVQVYKAYEAVKNVLRGSVDRSQI